MDLQRLKYFLEVARQKHFSKAAIVCCVSQPSLSQQIKKLESEVGGSLFKRTRGKITLTSLGEDFLKHAQAILANVQSAEEFITDIQDDSQRTIRFGAIPTIAPYIVPNLFSSIQNHYPVVRFELFENFTEVLIDDLLTGKIDFALLSPPTNIDSDCDYVSLENDELLLTLPADHSLCSSSHITSDMLADERFMMLESSHCLADQAGKYCKELGLNDAVDIRSSQIDTLLGLVEKGFGLSFTPAMAAKAHPHRNVVYRSMADNPCHREIRIVWLKRQFLSKPQKAVLEGVKQMKGDKELSGIEIPINLL